MKKVALFGILAAFAATAFAALEFSAARAIPVLEPQSVSSGATNAAAVVVHGLKGTSEVVVYANAQTNRTALNVTLWTTNAVDGGWSIVAEGSTTNKAATIVRVPFAGQDVASDVKVGVGSIGGASTASAFILSY